MKNYTAFLIMAEDKSGDYYSLLRQKIGLNGKVCGYGFDFIEGQMSESDINFYLLKNFEIPNYDYTIQIVDKIKGPVNYCYSEPRDRGESTEDIFTDIYLIYFHSACIDNFKIPEGFKWEKSKTSRNSTTDKVLMYLGEEIVEIKKI